ncbi:FMN binding oxidoreductase [Pleomassaria siparia CBS 279.74]|uniref:FMN binding oxidoreductase n=1 Tax=Pleomassaria siparia CBS 279.74 TaxID=1314801 RepID=A0A6G1K454_9PLEO|nr:FMN binding oxidoreductase [Pleomassaria siparia CBS 279.74]
MTSLLNSKVETPCGLVFPNRLVKAAMGEGMADASEPGDKYVQAYSTWGEGTWGGLLTGNVEVSVKYRGSNESVGYRPSPSAATRQKWTRWALASQKDGTPTIVQLVHPGRQCPVKSGERGFFEPSISPSAVPLKLGDGILERVLSKLVFGTPREMAQQDIDQLVQEFVGAAKLCHEAGFKGVELHGAHGYLLSQFLSPKTNLRTDAYGGTAAKRTKIVIDIIRAIRKEVPASFCVGIKLNSADVGGSESLEESLEQVGLIVKEQVDFLEISGGSYENLRVPASDKPAENRSAKREAFFIDYAIAVRARYPKVILMVTGGFRSRAGMVAALESNACDLIGLGRPAVIFPHLPKDVLLNQDVEDKDAVTDLPIVQGGWLVRKLAIKLLNVGVDTVYYVGQIRRMAIGQTPVPPPKA